MTKTKMVLCTTRPSMLEAIFSLAALFYLITNAAAATAPFSDLSGSVPNYTFSLAAPSYATDFAGRLSGIGDMNNDGVDDILVSAQTTPGPGFFPLWVVFGQHNQFSNINLTTTSLADTYQGFQITSSARWTYFGLTMSRGGDVNGDGIDDILLGAAQSTINNIALVVIYGGRNVNTDIDLSVTDLATTQQGFILTASLPGCGGGSVSNAGDINNDGIDDMIMANYGPTGLALVYFGKSSGLNDLNIGNTNLAATNQGFKVTIPGGNSNYFGKASGCLGDINNDGIDDIFFGASKTNSSTGAIYVFFGRTGGFDDIALNVTDLATAGLGFRVIGPSTGSWLGYSVSRAGDVNGDGIDDLVIGAYGYNSSKGAAYVIFGKQGTFADINLAKTSLSASQQGFRVTGAAKGNQFGYSVSNIGDQNYDGIDDVLIGAPGAGVSYVVYGRRDNYYDINLNTTNLYETGQGFNFSVNRSDYGKAVSNGGDINKDGINDIIIGSPGKRSAYSILSDAKSSRICHLILFLTLF